MKQKAGDHVSRWRDRVPDGATLEDRAATLIRGSLTPSDPDPMLVLRVEDSLGLRSHKRKSSALVLRAALACIFLLAGVATVKAFELARQAGWLGRWKSAEPEHEPSDRGAARRLLRPALPAPVINPIEDPQTVANEAAAAKADIPTSEEPTLNRQAPVRERSLRKPLAVRRTSASTISPQTSQPLADAPALATSLPIRTATTSQSPSTKPVSSDEIRELDRALGLLRRDHDASAALASLDAYMAHFPHGVLGREARLARIDALLMLGRSADALAALETLPLDGGRRSTELQVIRAELRARSSCARAEEDFSAALTRSPDAALLERVLYGRGVCRTRLGNRSGAASDLERYLERFPNGGHAAWARQWLQSVGRVERTGN